MTNINKTNKMREIKIECVVLHCSTADQAELDRTMKMLKLISGATPVKTLAKKRIPAFKIRPGMQIGCKVTVRKKPEELLKVLFTGISELNEEQFGKGTLSFGIKEYIQIPSISYQRDIGILGFDVAVNLKRSGLRVVKRKIARSKIPKRHRITKAETIEFFKKNFDINIVEK